MKSRRRKRAVRADFKTKRKRYSDILFVSEVCDDENHLTERDEG